MFIQMVGLPLVMGLLMGGVLNIGFTFVYFNFLATLFGIHILIWNAASVSCYLLGLRLVWGVKPKRRGLGLALTLAPVLLITLLLIFGEGHGA